MRIASWLETLYIRECLYTTKTVQEEKFLLVVWSESLVNIKDVGTVDIPDEEKEKKNEDLPLSVCLYFQQETIVTLT